MANASDDSYPDWHNSYMQNLTTATTTAEQQQSNNMFLMQSNAQQQQQYQYRKFSVDLPAVPSFASKRLDILDRSNSRLTPSYSNPDLAASARRMGSLDAGIRLRRYDQGINSSSSSDEFMDNNSSLQQQQQYMNSGRHHSLFNTSIYNNQLPNMAATPSPSTLISSPSSSSSANPLLVSHYMRQISKSRPPSPPLGGSGSRKNSLVMQQQQQLRRTSSATTMNVSSTEQDKFAFIQLEDVVDEIYALCKDQYGCRFFQKKLEEQKPEQRDLIFIQIYSHFVELMTGKPSQI